MGIQMPSDPYARRAIVRNIIETSAQRHGVPVAIADSVAWTESRYNPNAVSSAGAVGVMQLMPATARSLGVADPTDVEANVDGGVRYLRKYWEHFNAGSDADITDPNTWVAVLAAYNWGPGRVNRLIARSPDAPSRAGVVMDLAPESVQSYVRTVLGRARQDHGFGSAELLDVSSPSEPPPEGGRGDPLPLETSQGSSGFCSSFLCPLSDGAELTVFAVRDGLMLHVAFAPGRAADIYAVTWDAGQLHLHKLRRDGDQ